MRTIIERLFQFDKNQTTRKQELVGGITMFLASMYILFVNGVILSETGMPQQGIFIATAITAAICTLFGALYANLPFVIAPGMSANAFFAYAICLGIGYRWQEALAITFIAGILHVVIMLTPARKALITAIPEHIGIAASAGIGMFVARVAVDNSGLFTSTPGGADGLPVAQVPFAGFNPTNLIPIAAFAILVILLAIEHRSNEKFAALPISILITAFLFIPFNLSRYESVTIFAPGVVDEFKAIFVSFFGRPGMRTIFSTPAKLMQTILLILLMTMTDILNSIGTLLGIGYNESANLIDREEMELLKTKQTASRIDRGLIANAFGGIVSSLFGSSSATIYLESTTGILIGGRTGYAGMVAGILFLCCIPVTGLFRLIPIEAAAPAMLYTGCSMMSRMRNINWSRFEEALPAFVVIALVPLTNSILDGICIGLICYIVISLFLSERKRLSPTLYVIAFAYIITKIFAVAM